MRDDWQLCFGVRGGLQGLADLAEVGCLPLQLHEALEQRQLAGQKAPLQHLAQEAAVVLDHLGTTRGAD